MKYGRKAREADEVIRRWLEESGLPVGAQLPSERQLAKDLGLPHSVVNRAMNRILAEGRVERLGYRLFRSADTRPAVPQAPFDVVVLQRSKRLPSLRKVALELGLSLREHLCASTDELVRHLAALNQSATKRVILVPPPRGETAEWEPAARQLNQSGIPVICLGRRLAGFSSVASDRGLEQIFERLALLGHTELALLVASPWKAAIEEMTVRWTALCGRFASESSAGRVMFQNSSHMLREDLLAIAEQLQTDWKPVTALVISTDDDLPMQRLLDMFKRYDIAVPGRLSLISLFDHPALPTSVPPVAAAVEDVAMENEAAFLLARRAERKKERLGLLPPPTEMDIALDLNERSSLVPGPFVPAAPARRNRPPHALPIPGLALDQDDPTLSAQTAYNLTRNLPASRFRALNLTEKVNRPLNFRRGWLGDLPFGSLPPGTHHFHGVPFRVLGGSTRRDRGAIVFQSLRNTTGSTAKLPTKIRIPVNSRAAAIYVLHGCGYVKDRTRFGSYTFFPHGREPESVPLVALGRPQPGAGTWELAEAITEANIQDWWPDYPHCDFRHARMVPLPDSASSGPVRGHVYLYTLEWINPSPEVPVSHLEIEADPDQSTTLGVLAISALKPASAGSRVPKSGAKTPPPARRSPS